MKIKLLLITAGIISIPSFLSAQISNGLLLNYNFNTTVEDQSTNGNDGTVSNLLDTTNHLGNSNSAMYFDGVNGHVVLPTNSSIKPNLPITFTVNLKVDNLNSTRPIYHSDVYYNNYAGFWINIDVTGKIYAHISADLGSGATNRRTFATNETISAGVWNRITVVINAYNDMKVYINCTQATGTYSGSGATTMVYTNNPGYIGQGAANSGLPNPYFFRGSMDEIGLWNRALTTTEITAICNGALTIDEIDSNNFSIYPNPASTMATIKFNTEITSKELYYTIIDLTGRVVANNKISSIDQIIKFEDLSKGTYLVNIYDENKIIGSKKLTIN